MMLHSTRPFFSRNCVCNFKWHHMKGVIISRVCKISFKKMKCLVNNILKYTKCGNEDIISKQTLPGSHAQTCTNFIQ